MRTPNRAVYGTDTGSAFHYETKPVQFAPGRPPIVPQVRAASLTNYAGVARFAGLDPLTMLRRVGIRSGCAHQEPDRMIPRKATAELLEDSARQSGCESFGLLMAECRSLHDFGALSLLIMHQETARGVVEVLVDYQGLLSGAHAVDLDERDGTAVIRTEFAGRIGSRQAIDLLDGHGLPGDQRGGERPLAPGKRAFPAAGAAGPLHPSPHLSVRARLQFRIQRSRLLGGIARRAQSRRDSVVARHARRYLDMLAPNPADGSIGERARRAVYLMLPAGRGTLEQVAENIGLHPRMLQRQLEKEGRTFAPCSTTCGATRLALSLELHPQCDGDRPYDWLCEPKLLYPLVRRRVRSRARGLARRGTDRGKAAPCRGAATPLPGLISEPATHWRKSAISGSGKGRRQRREPGRWTLTLRKSRLFTATGCATSSRLWIRPRRDDYRRQVEAGAAGSRSR